MEHISLPIQKSYWVIPGRFRAGEHPGINTDAETRMKIHWLMESGTNIIINLTDTLLSGVDYSACISDTASLLNQQMTYKRIPIQDFSLPSCDKMVEILDVIDLALSEGKNIYLHCYAGIGRTGMTVGCYLARHGTPGDKALEMIQKFRKEIMGDQRLSPETDKQRRMVKEWMKDQ